MVGGDGEGDAVTRLRLVPAAPKPDHVVGPDRLRADLQAALRAQQGPIATLRKTGRHVDAERLSNLLTLYQRAAAEILKRGEE